MIVFDVAIEFGVQIIVWNTCHEEEQNILQARLHRYNLEIYNFHIISHTICIVYQIMEKNNSNSLNVVFQFQLQCVPFFFTIILLTQKSLCIIVEN